MSEKSNGEQLEGTFIQPPLANPMHYSVAMHPFEYSLRDQTRDDATDLVVPHPATAPE